MTEGMLKVNKRNLNNISKTIPIKRVGQLKEVAEVILKLVKKKAKGFMEIYYLFQVEDND